MVIGSSPSSEHHNGDPALSECVAAALLFQFVLSTHGPPMSTQSSIAIALLTLQRAEQLSAKKAGIVTARAENLIPPMKSPRNAHAINIEFRPILEGSR